MVETRQGEQKKAAMPHKRRLERTNAKDSPNSTKITAPSEDPNSATVNDGASDNNNQANRIDIWSNKEHCGSHMLCRISKVKARNCRLDRKEQ